MRLNGSSWEVAPSPSPGDDDNILYSVASVSDSDIWAVGSSRNYYYPDETLIVHWDGGKWTWAPSPNRAWSANYFYAVAALSASDIWAAGESGYYNYDWQTLIARYAGRINFQDVGESDYYYEAVRNLYCGQVISGYADNTFRPYNNTTRGQLVKIIVLAERLPLYTPPTPTFSDVPASNPFYPYVETAAAGQLIVGYDCGGPGEPCPGLYFRPNAQVTRAQLTKIIVLAEGWQLLNPPNPAFADLPYGSTYYRFVATAVAHGIISGYDCGHPEPCDPQRRPYFRPTGPATRGQIAKIVYNAVISP
jgi:hypothetical protein